MSELLQRRSLSEQVYDVLIHDIVTGQIALGDRLINRELQTRFGVSSTPIRDAINKLYQDGLIRELTNSGAQLIDFDQQYAEELNHFIMMLACEALALASQSDQQAEIVRLLHEYQDAMEASQENDTEYFGADYRFHKVFFDYCGQPLPQGDLQALQPHPVAAHLQCHAGFPGPSAVGGPAPADHRCL